MLTCSGSSRPASFIRPRCSASSVARLTSSAMSASFCCWIWVAAIGRPNAIRSLLYSSAASKQARAAPAAPHTIP